MKKNWFLAGAAITMMLLSRQAEAFVLINEFLADPPPGLAGDANRDGVRDPSGDEFVELLNATASDIDLSLWTISDAVSIRHTFASGSVLRGTARLVVFGGGVPDTFPYAAVGSSTGRLGLNNSGDTITLRDDLGTIIDQTLYGAEGGQSQSLTRYPEGAGGFALHLDVSSAGLALSPGTGVEGMLGQQAPPVVPEASSLSLIAIAIATILGFQSFVSLRTAA